MISERAFYFANRTGDTPNAPKPWTPLVVPAAAIAQEIERLAELDRPANGRRAATVVHPSSTAPGLGLAPGVDVTINVLKPGETTTLVRRNSNQVEICIGGSGAVTVGNQTIAFGKWDVWNIPAMQSYAYRNTGNDLCVRLSYSNAPLLEKLGIHYCDEQSTARTQAEIAAELLAREMVAEAAHVAPDVLVSADGARLRGYEYLVDIEVVESKALHWPWATAAAHLSLVPGDGKRNILLLFNPVTGRRNGTTPTFFATLATQPHGTPPRRLTRGHWHSSVAINYYFVGRGKSIVDDVTYEWNAGDLMLSAPSWTEHAHYLDSSESYNATLTIQDHPLHIAMESLIWQEDVNGAILTLGSQAGPKGYVAPRERED